MSVVEYQEVVQCHQYHLITFVCMPSAVPIQCLHSLKADALSLNPPRLVLAGLLADTIVTAP